MFSFKNRSDRNSIYSCLAEEINKFFSVLKFWQDEYHNQQEKLKISRQDDCLCSFLNQDIILSHSGQEKINNRESCLNLVSADFIVF